MMEAIVMHKLSWNQFYRNHSRAVLGSDYTIDERINIITKCSILPEAFEHIRQLLEDCLDMEYGHDEP